MTSYMTSTSNATLHAPERAHRCQLEPARGALLVLGLLALGGWGCAADDPRATQLDGSTEPGLDTGGDGPACAISWTLPVATFDDPGCEPTPGDFLSNSPGADSWPGCVSDDGLYHRFESSVSSIARVAAFEQIATLLLDGTTPSPQDFIDAKLAYTQPEGLDSRLSRREDEHLAPAPVACAEMDQAQLQQHPDRCVGQTQLQPLLSEAFAAGARGQEPLRNAGRIEGALLWFLYLSVYKEATTCSDKLKDCDSAYAYYTGGEPAAGGLGLARYLLTASPQAHRRAWDGLLAVRCWRDLDPAVPAADLARRDQARAQLDRALRCGLARVLRARLALLAASCDSARLALWESARLLARPLQLALAEQDPAQAARLAEQLRSAAPAAAELEQLDALLAARFPCP